MKRYTLVLLFMICLQAQAKCYGKMTNPITDICWSCIFPISIGGLTVKSGADKVDTQNPSNSVCSCGSPIPRLGISIGFWEPVRLTDVTHDPFCFINLGGITLDPGKFIGRGTQTYNDAMVDSGNYQVHWYHYPALFWLELLLYATCLEQGQFDIAYMTEFDPLWNDDTLSFLINPEAALFGNPIAQAACAADCATVSTNMLANDALYWCAGCQGSMYPLSGKVANQVSPIQASTLLVERMTFKLHREHLLWGTMGSHGLCASYPMPIMKKSQYKLQMTYPVTGNLSVASYACNPYGRTTNLWESGKQFPIKGEGFGYLVWRKRNCCAF